MLRALDERQKERIVHRLERRIAQLGYKVASRTHHGCGGLKRRRTLFSC